MDEHQIRAIVVDVLGVPPLRAERMTLSHSGNVVYCVELAGRDVIVRTRDTPGAFEHTEHNLAALRDLGLPVPSLLAADLSRTRHPAAYLILDKMPGRDLLYELPTMTRPQMTRLAEQIVSFQRQVATLPRGTGFGWGRVGGGGAESAWLRVFRPGPDPDNDALRDLSRRIDRQIVRFQPYFRSVPPTCFLEDLTTKNVLLSDGALQGLIDFDAVCFGDPLWMIGLAAACIVNDVGTQGLFYIDELCRCGELMEVQRQVVALYAAVRAMEFAGESLARRDGERTRRLLPVMDSWLETAERSPARG